MTKIIVTSGPTREFFDPVRFLSNPSTGKMGHAIAQAAVKAQLDVVYICGPVEKKSTTVNGAKNISVVSTLDMLAAVQSELAPGAILVMAAAPSDFRPATRLSEKAKKSESIQWDMVPNPDILKTVGEDLANRRWDMLLYGFAAETRSQLENALIKLSVKKLNAIFLNNVLAPGSGFGSDFNELVVLRKDGSSEIWKDTKQRLGEKIIEEIRGALGTHFSSPSR